MESGHRAPPCAIIASASAHACRACSRVTPGGREELTTVKVAQTRGLFGPCFFFRPVVSPVTPTCLSCPAQKQKPHPALSTGWGFSSSWTAASWAAASERLCLRLSACWFPGRGQDSGPRQDARCTSVKPNRLCRRNERGNAAQGMSATWSFGGARRTRSRSCPARPRRVHPRSGRTRGQHSPE